MRIFPVLIIYSLLTFSTLFAEASIGADVVSRYVWRGTDYGNAAAVQPFIETNLGPITVGAWGSWSISPGLYFNGTQEENGDDIMVGEASGNECDLYASTTVGPVGLTLTDYFFPAYGGTDSLLNLDKHTIELSGAADLGPVSILAAAYVSGDYDGDGNSRNSIYLELKHGTFSLGLGNGAYSIDGEFAPVSLAVSAERDNFSVSYIINPNKETSFLVFGVNF